jgi:hypothetical protein
MAARSSISREGKMAKKRISMTAIKAANRYLNDLISLSHETIDGLANFYRFHAEDGTRHVLTLVAAGQPLPEPLLRNINFLKACGWRFC